MSEERTKTEQALANARSKWSDKNLSAVEVWNDRMTLGDAYLIEHPDDEDEPITREWLIETGMPIHVDLGSDNRLRTGFPVAFQTKSEDKWRMQIPLFHIRTRGQLRQLIKLLKVGE